MVHGDVCQRISGSTVSYYDYKKIVKVVIRFCRNKKSCRCCVKISAIGFVDPPLSVLAE